jgi:hypothetical protein
MRQENNLSIKNIVCEKLQMLRIEYGNVINQYRFCDEECKEDMLQMIQAVETQLNHTRKSLEALERFESIKLLKEQTC